jgi:hypothetical protein
VNYPDGSLEHGALSFKKLSDPIHPNELRHGASFAIIGVAQRYLGSRAHMGATGGMLIGTVLDELERQDKTLGLVTMRIAGGMGIATIIERL